MPGITLRYIVYDLLHDFKQIHKDSEIKPFQMLFWVISEANYLKKQHEGKIDSGAFITRFNVPIAIDHVFHRQYFELPASIFDYDRDEGITYLCYSPNYFGTTGAPTTTLPGQPEIDIPQFSTITFTRTTPAKSARLYFRDEERPSTTNPYFYRLNKNIYLLGVESVEVSAIEVGLRTSFDPLVVSLSFDQEFEFPSELLPILKRRILDLGRFVLSVPSDLMNDGTGLQSKSMPTQKLLSVNDRPQDYNNRNNDQDGY